MRLNVKKTIRNITYIAIPYKSSSTSYLIVIGIDYASSYTKQSFSFLKRFDMMKFRGNPDC
jgi:hypothetical protein